MITLPIRLVAPARGLALVVLMGCALMAQPARAQNQPAAPPPGLPSAPTVPQPQATGQVPVQPPPNSAGSVPLPKDYVIGIEDVISVVFWSERDLSAEVVVRPDGKISLPMLNDLSAAGMTPEQLAESIQQAALKFVRNAGATVIVKQVNSRKVYVIGEVNRPGTFALSTDVNVMQIIAQAGGFLEHAKKGDVVIVRTENGQERRYKFNYNDVVRGKNVAQNILLRPGDTILVR